MTLPQKLNHPWRCIFLCEIVHKEKQSKGKSDSVDGMVTIDERKSD